MSARGAWVELPKILALGIAQYNSRLFELRRMGFRIENRREGKHSWFRLVTGPTVPDCTRSQPDNDSLFGNIAPDRSYRE
jgi:hypothetical protein